MTLEEKQQDIIDEFAIYDDWIRESGNFRRPNVSAVKKRIHHFTVVF